MTSTFDRVAKITAEHLGVEAHRVTPEAKLEDLGADSLDHVELVMAFEEEFRIEITDQEAEKVVTVKDAVETIDQIIARDKEAA